MGEIYEPNPQTWEPDVGHDGGRRLVREEPGEGRNLPMLQEELRTELQTAWHSIQADFVDDPRAAVARAEELVDRCMRELSEAFKRERASLEESWARNEEVSTEELRIALRRYRAFFQRFLSM